MKRFGCDRILIVGGHGSGLPRDDVVIEDVDTNGLDAMAALRALSDRLDPVFLLVEASTLSDFNWLALVPLLLGAPGALVATAISRPSRAAEPFEDAGVCAVRRDAVGTAAGASSWTEVLSALARAGRVRVMEVGPPVLRTGRHGARDKQGAAAGSLRRAAVFFDRDGVLNVDHGYVGDVGRFEWLPGAVDAVRAVNEAGLFAFLVTNQSGIARGYYSEAALVDLHRHMQCDLRARGAHLDDIRYCPHLPEASVEAFRILCACRKPAPGMILDLLDTWPVDREGSVLIGDKASDLEAARRAGIRGVLYTGGDLASFLPASVGSARTPST